MTAFTDGFSGKPVCPFCALRYYIAYGGYWLSEIRGKNPGMMTLICFVITATKGYSAAAVFGLKGMDFFVWSQAR
ncbi:hypothetical protein ACEN9X_26990 [Mucilaginibacter sp. Mucisp86]|uniref:hypothetical protein n=1 Tax=Mucilaginibacter sp. Mucisp86 TaxID=3243060 RepID=UPI0039B49444